MTAIEWTDKTWNPTVGCNVISAGCRNCYAMRQAHRLAANPATPHYRGTTTTVRGKPVWTGVLGVADAPTMYAPYRRRKPTRYFVNSMSDLFHPGFTLQTVADVFAVMARCDQHDFQILTKRPDHMRDVLRSDEFWNLVEAAAEWQSYDLHDRIVLLAPRQRAGIESGVLPNVWLGTSAEDQRWFDARWPYVRETPAAVRWISAEPLLGPITIKPYDLALLDWVVAGGETGPGARIMHPDWIRGLRDQCAVPFTPFHFKHWGVWRAVDEILAEGAELPDDTPTQWVGGSPRIGLPGVNELFARVGKKRAGRMLDGREWNEYPGAA